MTAVLLPAQTHDIASFTTSSTASKICLFVAGVLSGIILIHATASLPPPPPSSAMSASSIPPPATPASSSATSKPRTQRPASASSSLEASSYTRRRGNSRVASDPGPPENDGEEEDSRDVSWSAAARGGTSAPTQQQVTPFSAGIDWDGHEGRGRQGRSSPGGIPAGSSSSDAEYTSDDEVREEDVDGNVTEQTDDTERLLQLLSAISEEQAEKDGFVHRSITCNHCGKSPIRGFRFKCANCVDYDVCEACEALEVHLKTHVFVKIRIPIPPLMNARSALFPVIYPGEDFTNEHIEYNAAELQKRTQFDVIELDAFHEQFLSLSNSDEGGIDRVTFERCLGPLGLEKNLIVERLFCFFDRNRDDVISFEELVMGLSVLCKGDLDERMKWAFRGYDLNDDGRISREELHRMFKAYFHLSMELVRDVVKTMEEGMMESFDDEAAKPVSAAFAGPSGPYTGTVANSSSDEDDGGGEHADPEAAAAASAARAKRRQLRRAKRVAEDGYDILANFAVGGSSNAHVGANRRTSGASTSSSVFSPPYPSALLIPPNNRSDRHSSGPAPPPPPPLSPSAAGSSPSPLSSSSATRPVRRLNLRRSLPHLSTSSPLRASLDPSSPQHHLFAHHLPSPSTVAAPPHSAIEEQWPIMEAMSQDAIEEMVDKVFESAGKEDAVRRYHEHGTLEEKDGLDFEDFVRVVEVDSNILAWFEALGSVF
ncbi:hypothetical protein HDU87_007733 [Geranomyces variabilis]|uniref:Uncharacterized protein n=1 Tax=Geranomyces variabilis TaxID=109894 RepID=A0AAD5TDR1_9FUNG|nr:hypothetical protein HDU87_007733 [Geranomyces variabilis]